MRISRASGQRDWHQVHAMGGWEGGCCSFAHLPRSLSWRISVIFQIWVQGAGGGMLGLCFLGRCRESEVSCDDSRTAELVSRFDFWRWQELVCMCYGWWDISTSCWFSEGRTHAWPCTSGLQPLYIKSGCEYEDKYHTLFGSWHDSARSRRANVSVVCNNNTVSYTAIIIN